MGKFIFLGRLDINNVVDSRLKLTKIISPSAKKVRFTQSEAASVVINGLES